MNLTNLSVMLAIPAGRPPEWDTAIALAETFVRCMGLRVPIQLGIVKNCSVITKARDELVSQFLASDANRLFWVDSDTDWTADDFLRLLELSQTVDVVGAQAALKTDPPTFPLDVTDPHAVEVVDGLWKVNGLGLCFCCMTWEAVAAVAYSKPIARDQNGEAYRAVFRTDIHDGAFRGEDMAFLADVREAGYDVWLDPSIELGHFGVKRYSGSVQAALPQEVGCAS